MYRSQLHPSHANSFDTSSCHDENIGAILFILCTAIEVSITSHEPRTVNVASGEATPHPAILALHSVSDPSPLNPEFHWMTEFVACHSKTTQRNHNPLCGCRIGEADNPGPVPKRKFRPQFANLAIINPTAINNKEEELETLINDYQIDTFCCAETTATAEVQKKNVQAIPETQSEKLLESIRARTKTKIRYATVHSRESRRNFSAHQMALQTGLPNPRYCRYSTR